MNKAEPPIPPQRQVRDLNVPPGFWKRQLPTRYLAIASRGDIAGLRQLLAQHPTFLNHRGGHGRTLLWEAARRGKLDAVQWLAEQGAELDATGAYNGESFVQLTPYCAAVYYRRPQVADYLLAQGARLDIFRLAFLGDQAGVAAELAHHPELLNAEDPHDFIYHVPLLAFPIVSGRLAMLDFLLQRGAIVPPYSATLIMLAARDGRLEFIERLVAYGADVRAASADVFVTISDLHVIDYLLRHGVSASKQMANGFTPLIYLSRGDKGEHPEKIQLLFEHGASVNVPGPKGRTALHYAAAAGHLRVIALLLEHGADPTLKDDAGETALSLAQSRSKPAAMDLLSSL